MSGSASSGSDALPGRVFDDLREHERSRGSTEPDGDDLLLGEIALEWKLVDRRTLDELAGAPGPLERNLVDRGILKPDDLAALLRERKLRLEGLPEIPRYEIRSRIGEGATAVVYAAWDRELKRDVALKVLRRRSEL